jgi:uncharacterized phage-associated protein
MPFDSATIANLFLDHADRQGLPIDHMKVQKLVYIAHGWHLAFTDRALIRDRVEAWPYGPVIPKLYQAFKSFGARRIEGRADAPGLEAIGSQDDVSNALTVVGGVWDVYKVYSAVQLSAMTHQPGTPWATVTQGQQVRGREIPNAVIRDHYKLLATQRTHARA